MPIKKAAAYFITSIVFLVIGFILSVNASRSFEKPEFVLFSVLALFAGVLFAEAAAISAYEAGRNEGKRNSTIVEIILDEYTNLLNIFGKDSKEEIEFRKRFTGNKELLKLFDAIVKMKAGYQTTPQSP